METVAPIGGPGVRAGLAWIGNPGASGEEPRGQWGQPSELSVPLDDRGLSLADGLFETLLVARGRPWLLAEHLRRWRQGANLLGLPDPPKEDLLAPLIGEAIRRGGFRSGALRLTWSRGGGGRGLDLPEPSDPPLHPRFWLRLSPWRPTFAAARVMVSPSERRHPASLTSRCKTLAYGWAVQARRQARAAGADDALVLNTSGELCCGTTANLLLRVGGVWLTPPTASGCLPGVMRARALALDLAREAPLVPECLERAEAGLLLNSLDCRPLNLREGPHPEEAMNEARQFWRRCVGLAP
ncbi:MAG: aminotransferase class IV [Cyanobacteriota bacterium]